MAHVNTKKCEIKKCTDQSSMCARHVWAALSAGGLNVQGGDAGEINTNNAAMQQQAGYKQIFNEGGSLPEYAMPGDVVLKSYISKGRQSGHAEFFTGKHWVSDAIQPTGLTWARGNNSREAAFDTIYAIWRIPNIEKALVGTSSGDGFPSDAQLLYMLKYAEGTGLHKWAWSPDGAAISSTGVNGYDLAGGVHSSDIAKKINQTPASSIGQTSLDGITWVWYRDALGSEVGKEYKATKNGRDIMAVNSYWRALVPFYRSRIEWAWEQPVVKQESDIGTKLAMCHTMAWVHNKDTKFTKGSNWKRRLEVAQQAVRH